MPVSYEQLKGLAGYMAMSLTKGPPESMTGFFDKNRVEGIQTGGLLAVQLIAIMAALADGVEIKQAQQDFQIPEELTKRAPESLISAVRIIMEQFPLRHEDIDFPEGAPKPTAEQLAQDPSYESIGFKKYLNFMIALNEGIKTVYNELKQGHEPFGCTAEEFEYFNNGVDFALGSIVISLSEVTKRSIRTCAESVALPERVIVEIEEADRELAAEEAAEAAKTNA